MNLYKKNFIVFLICFIFPSCASMKVYDLVYPASIKPDPALIQKIEMDSNNNLRFSLKSNLFFTSEKCLEKKENEYFQKSHAKDFGNCTDFTNNAKELEVDKNFSKSFLPLLDNKNNYLDLSPIGSTVYLLYEYPELYKFTIDKIYSNSKQRIWIIKNKSENCFVFERHEIGNAGYYSALDQSKRLYSKEECLSFLKSPDLIEIKLKQSINSNITIEFRDFTRFTYLLPNFPNSENRNLYLLSSFLNQCSPGCCDISVSISLFFISLLYSTCFPLKEQSDTLFIFRLSAI